MKFFDDDFLKNILKQFILGASFAFGFLTFGIFAVTISGTINTFATGQVIKASDINTNFASIKATLENIPDWVKSGANASYPSGGITVNTSTQLNSATVTVNGNANAHMCTSHEMIISRQLNIAIPANTWFATFVNADSNGVINAYRDCIGYTDSNGIYNGSVYTGVYGSYSGCNGIFNIACCL